jgi:uncharacterized membrane protein YfcA
MFAVLSFSGSFSLLLWLAAISLLAGVAKGVSGFGAALIMAPLFGLLLPAPAAAALVVLLHAATSLQGYRVWAPQVRWKVVAPLALVALACTVLTMNLIATGSKVPWHRVVGAVVLLATLLHVCGWRWRHAGGVGPTMLAGMASGAMTALGGMGGAPAVVFFSGAMAGDTAAEVMRLRANLLGYFSILFLGASLILCVRHQVDVPLLVCCAVLIPAFVVGMLIGEKLYRHLPPVWITRSVTVLLLGSACLSLLT